MKMASWKVLFTLLMVLGYSIMVHVGVLSGFFVPALLVFTVIVSLSLIKGTKNSRKLAWVLAISLGLVAGIFWKSDSLLNLFYLPPVLINCFLLTLFGATLLPGATPLITQFSEILKGDLDQKALNYTRRVTQAWVVFFFFMTVETLLLAVYAPPYVWSLFTNFINYLLLALFFLLEFYLRKHLFREVDQPGFFGFLKSLVQVDPRSIKTF